MMEFLGNLFSNALSVTVLVILATSLVGFYVKMRGRDRCLRDLDGFHVTVETKDHHVAWGALRTYATGVELLYIGADPNVKPPPPQAESAEEEKEAKMKEKEGPEISVIVPMFNEGGNVSLLYEKLSAVLKRIGKHYEMIFVDDGSSDNTLTELKVFAHRDPNVRVLALSCNCGQTAALSAGIDHSRGKTIIPMDGDLQNEPEDILPMLQKLEEGYDVVSGWRKDRKDHFLRRTLPSVAANKLISWISGVSLHDYGCTLKVYRREVIKNVRLYGEMHRFIPIYSHWAGGRVTEIPVRHRAREFGSSKYGMSRILKVILDLMVVKFLLSYSQKPIYIFGGFGVLMMVGAFLSGLYALYLKFFEGTSFILTPLPLLCVLLLMLGFISILMGFLAEILTRTYYESQGKPTYQIKEVISTSE